ncbi:MAG: AraC family transcriptional regulator [Chitinophagaceae bacterium]
MKIRFLGFAGNSLAVPSAIPVSSLNGHLIPDTEQASFSYPDGNLLIQQRQGTETELYYVTATAASNHTVSYTTGEAFLGLLIVLQNNYYLSVAELDKLFIQENSFNLLHIPNGMQTMHLLKNNHHRVLYIHYPKEYLEQLSVHYTVLQPFMEAVDTGQAAILDQGHRIAPKGMLDTIDQLLYSSFPGGKGQYAFYLEVKSRDLLLHTLLAFTEPDVPANRVIKTTEDYETIYRLKRYLETHTGQRPTYQQLCKMAGWNKDKLQKAFRQVYNMSIMECYQEILMTRARKMVESTSLPIKEISRSLGYDREHNFTRAYIRHFGNPPTANR